MRDVFKDPQPGDAIMARTVELHKYPSGKMNVYRRVTKREGTLVHFRARGNAHSTNLENWAKWAEQNNVEPRYKP